MSARASDWIAAAGLRVVEADARDVSIPLDILADPDLSLMPRQPADAVWEAASVVGFQSALNQWGGRLSACLDRSNERTS